MYIDVEGHHFGGRSNESQQDTVSHPDSVRIRQSGRIGDGGVTGCVMRSPNSSLICILGWLKSDLGVVFLCFGFDSQISGEKGETAYFWKIRRSTPRRRSARLSVGTHV